MERKTEEASLSRHPLKSRDLAGSAESVKITFHLPEEDQVGEIVSEGFWAESLGDGRYRLDNIPFFVYGVSLDDVVSAAEVDGLLTFREVVSSGGHSTYRVFLRDPLPSTAVLDERLAALRALGAKSERATRWLIAFDVPPDADIEAIYRVLEYGEDTEGLWTLDEGHVGRR